MKLPMTLAPVVLAVLIAPALAAALRAQDMTDDELKALFQNQIEDIRAATQEPSLGASRGLVLNTVAQPGAESSRDSAPVIVEASPDAPVAPGADAPGGELRLQAATSGGVSATAPELAAAQTDAAPIQHWTLPKSEQVNFQVKFAFDSAALSADQKPELRRVCAVMNELDIQQFRIIGHTDASGGAEYNQKLSILRAEEVQRFFINDCGIAAGRLEAIGVGEQFPYNDKAPRDGVNRRVEFQALS